MTAMDDVSLHTPATQLRMGRLNAYLREAVDNEPNLGLRTRGLLSGLGKDEGVPDGTGGGSFLGAYYPAPEISPNIEALSPVDAADAFVTDSFSSERYTTLGALGQDYFPMEGPLQPPPDYSYVYGDLPPADAALPSTAPGSSPIPVPGSSWNWQDVMNKAPAMLRDLMLATTSADYQRQLTQINIDRAKKGQPPLAAGQYAPMVQVGVAPQTMKIAGIGAGTFLAVAIASAFGVTALMRKRRA
jgi:hypothetical protein